MLPGNCVLLRELLDEELRPDDVFERLRFEPD